RLVLDLLPDGLVGRVRAPQVQRRRLLQVGDELRALGLVEAELLGQLGALGLGQVVAAVEARDRVRLNDPEQEEVEADDEEQGRQRPQHLAADEACAHSRSYTVRRRRSRKNAAPPPSTTTAMIAMITPLLPPSSPPDEALAGFSAA